MTKGTTRVGPNHVLSTARHFDGFNGPIFIVRRSFYRATLHTNLLLSHTLSLSLSLSLSLVIGFARHCVASAREISARDRSFQASEKFMSCPTCKTREKRVINKYRNASIYGARSTVR